MNRPTYEAVTTAIDLSTSKPVSLEEWKQRVYHETLAMVEMMNREPHVDLKCIAGDRNELLDDGIRD